MSHWMRENMKAYQLTVLRDLQKSRGIKRLPQWRKADLRSNALRGCEEGKRKAQKNRRKTGTVTPFQRNHRREKEQIQVVNQPKEGQKRRAWGSVVMIRQESWQRINEWNSEVMQDGFDLSVPTITSKPGEKWRLCVSILIRKFNLETGDIIRGNTSCIKTQQEKFSALLYNITIHQRYQISIQQRKNFEDLTPIFFSLMRELFRDRAAVLLQWRTKDHLTASVRDSVVHRFPAESR